MTSFPRTRESSIFPSHWVPAFAGTAEFEALVSP